MWGPDLTWQLQTNGETWVCMCVKTCVFANKRLWEILSILSVRFYSWATTGESQGTSIGSPWRLRRSDFKVYFSRSSCRRTGHLSCQIKLSACFTSHLRLLPLQSLTLGIPQSQTAFGALRERLNNWDCLRDLLTLVSQAPTLQQKQHQWMKQSIWWNRIFLHSFFHAAHITLHYICTTTEWTRRCYL